MLTTRADAADRATLDAWWRASRARAGGLPEGVTPVHARLVRAVGRGRLPSLGEVHVKVMAFPRPKDRLRYLLRSLPARHEAHMLERVRSAGLACPEVVMARGERRLGLPRLSMLVTRSLELAATRPDPDERAAVAARLAGAGILHPDPNESNFAALAAGGVAILDLQSARDRGRSLGRRDRLAMAAKLLATGAPDPSCVVRAGLIRHRDLEPARRAALELRRGALLGRIRRCLSESSEFSVRRRWSGTLFRRRGAPDGGTWHEGGPELVRWWIGDRALEVLDGRPPVLGALFRKSCWLPGKHSVYIPRQNCHASLPERALGLLEGFRRFRAIARGGESPLPPAPGPDEPDPRAQREQDTTA